MVDILTLTLVLFTLGLIIAGSVTDFLSLKIPNLISIGVLMCFATTYGLSFLQHPDHITLHSISSHLWAGGIMFVAMLILFFMNLFGGGDAKLISAVSLWVGLKGLPVFLMVMTIVGGLLALISVCLRRTTIGKKILAAALTHEKLKNGWFAALNENKPVVPYGIAIAIGAIVSFSVTELLP